MAPRTRRFASLGVLFILTTVLAAGSAACSSDDGDGGGVTDPPPTNNDPTNRLPDAVIQSTHDAVPPGDNNQTVVTLDGTGSSDPDGDPLTYQWSVSGGNYVGGTDPSNAVVQVTFPGTAPYPVTLTVSDGRGGFDSANFLIDLR